VLVVDDNPSVRKLICELFARESDFQVCGEAENGREAIRKAQEVDPDLIVTDLSMPLMNGLEEACTLKKLMPEVPVIIYSAHMDPFFEKEAFGCRSLSRGRKNRCGGRADFHSARFNEARRLTQMLR